MAHVNVVADILTCLGVLKAIRRAGILGSADEGSALLDVVQPVGRRRTRPADRERQGTKNDCCFKLTCHSYVSCFVQNPIENVLRSCSSIWETRLVSHSRYLRAASLLPSWRSCTKNR